MREQTEVALDCHYTTNLRQSVIVLEEYEPENRVARLIDTVIEGMDTVLKRISFLCRNLVAQV